MPLNLEADGWTCRLLPECGGAIAALTRGGRAVLRAGAGPQPVDCASFPLLPFANRIGHGQLRHAGQAWQLDADPLARPHALHGHGWRRAWQVAAASAGQARLEYCHDGGAGWPWPYRARQDLALGESGLTIALTLTNLDPQRAMPAGTGLHPYFALEPDSFVQARAGFRWECDASGLATHRCRDATFASGAPVPLGRLAGLDHCFVSRGPVTVGGAWGTVVLGGPALYGFHLYAPAGADFFCVEPVSHAPDAFGRGAMRASDWIGPGRRRRWTWYLRAA
ncbi:MAG: aldose 1-epimerase [Proteobacteria bacterium]|nr:aldose 1-epimerase [Pseudomonadota bacterium]